MAGDGGALGRSIVLRYAGICVACGAVLAKGSSARWDRQAKTATCLVCPSGGPDSPAANDGEAEDIPIEIGTAGASARREYERRAERERRRKEGVVARDAAWRETVKAEHPILGRVATAMTAKPVIRPESHSTRAWKTGAVGEELVAEWLTPVPGIVALHDRRIPRSKANIDHIVVAPSGVYVIDAKRYSGRVERRNVGSLIRPNQRLFVGRRDCTKLAESVVRQARLVKDELDDDQPAVFAGLCFVEAEWSMFAKPFHLGSAWVGWPKAMTKWVAQEGTLGEGEIAGIVRRISNVFVPA